MQLHNVLAAAGIALTAGMLMTPAMAQSASADGDVAYCRALASQYERYGGQATNGRPSAETTAAIAMCNSGRPAEGIAQLEKILTAHGFTLPQRSVARGR
jgi:hypothetical protein